MKRMKRRKQSRASRIVTIVAFEALVLLLAGCRRPAEPPTLSLADRLEKLPALPADVAATLDPKTNATRVRESHPAPVRATTTGVALAPCCGSKDQKSLQVRVPLTKCAPLRDFYLAPLSDLVMAREAPGGSGGSSASGASGASGNVRAYRSGPVNRASAWDTIVCMTSDGPWAATLTEERNCNNYQPQDSLIVAGWGGLAAYNWNGGVGNHPPEILLVSCRDLGLFRYSCGGLSNCNCDSAPCPATQPCPCTLPW